MRIPRGQRYYGRRFRRQGGNEREAQRGEDSRVLPVDRSTQFREFVLAILKKLGVKGEMNRPV